MLKSLFNTGLREIEAQADVLDTETDNLMVAYDKAEKDIDMAVEQLELIRKARQLIKDNIRWIELELSHSKHILNYTETTQLYERYDSNHDEDRVMRSMHFDYNRSATNEVKLLANDFQDILNAYEDEIDVLDELIEEHASDSNKEQLNEVLSKYGIIYGSQVTKFNTYIEQYGFDDMVR